MTLEPSHLITLGFAAVAVIIWLVRLEGRVNGKATGDQVAAAASQIGAVAAGASSRWYEMSGSAN